MALSDAFNLQFGIDLLRRKEGTAGGFVGQKAAESPLVQESLGGFAAGATTGASLGAAGGPVGAGIGAGIGGVLGAFGGLQMGGRQRRQQQVMDDRAANIMFEAQRAEDQRKASLLEQTRTRARFSGGGSGSLLTG